MEMEKRIAFYTLGCKLNYAESSALSREFAKRGYKVVSPTNQADVYVINTCTVTEHSDKKSRNIIRRLHHICPDAIIAVIGCYAQLKADEIAAIEGVDIVLGADRKGELPDEVEKFIRLGGHSAGNHKAVDVSEICSVEKIFPGFSYGERTRSFLKVQDGCDYKCSYCTIPQARGKSRNFPISELVKQAEEIAGEGVREIVLTGVNTGDFGKSTSEDFLDLLKALNEVEGIDRYRISSIEPNLLREDIVKWIASGTKFLPHFHIPLQAGCDSVLRRMRRRYNTTMFKEKIELIRSLMGDNVFFGIDIITGFPGESEEEFLEGYKFLEEINPAFLHIFPYSARENTPAALMENQVRDSVKSQRVAKLEELCERLHSSFIEKNRGCRSKVLFESKQKNGTISGYTENYIQVFRPYDPELIGQIVEVEI